MALPVFTPPQIPSLSSSFEEEPRILRVDFGDGYSQRVADGLNSNQMKVTLNFDVLTSVELGTIRTFLSARGGYEAFTYTLPQEVSARKWICPRWNHQPNGNLFSLSAELEEVADLVT